MSPRVLILLRAPWPRALLRAQLKERGYDAVAAPTLEASLSYATDGRSATPVRLLIVDQSLLTNEDAREEFEGIRALHPQAALVLLAGTGAGEPEGEWAAVLRRPTTPTELLRTVVRLCPLNGSSGTNGGNHEN